MLGLTSALRARALERVLGLCIIQGQQLSSFASATSVVVKKDWSAVKIPETTLKNVQTTLGGGQAFANDLRGTSGLGLGDGITSHTGKWLAVGDGLQSSPNHPGFLQPDLGQAMQRDTL